MSALGTKRTFVEGDFGHFERLLYPRKRTFALITNLPRILGILALFIAKIDKEQRGIPFNSVF